jgi:hypothetical protein
MSQDTVELHDRIPVLRDRILESIRKHNPEKWVARNCWKWDNCYCPLSALLVDTCDKDQELRVWNNSQDMIMLLQDRLDLPAEFIVGFVHAFDGLLPFGDVGPYKLGYDLGKDVLVQLFEENYFFVVG